MARSKYHFQRRWKALWKEQDGRCCYCGCLMLHPNDLRSDPGKREKHRIKVSSDGTEQIKVMPRNLATLEHLNDRWTPHRSTPANGQKRWALACWQCNTDRGNERQAQQPIEHLHERSQRHRQAEVSP